MGASAGGVAIKADPSAYELEKVVKDLFGTKRVGNQMPLVASKSNGCGESSAPLQIGLTFSTFFVKKKVDREYEAERIFNICCQ